MGCGASSKSKYAPAEGKEDVRRLDVHDAAAAGGRGATGLLDEEGHRRGLVEQPELAVLVLGVGGVAEDAAVEERAVDVADHGADVAARVLRLGLARARAEALEVVLERLVPVGAVRLVARVDLAALRDLDARVREHELADVLIISKAVGAGAERHEEVRRRRVEHVARRDERVARLERRLEARVEVVGREVALVLLVLEDAEDRARRDARVDVARAVEGVEDGDVLARLE